jgi:hypothetical protein
MAEVSIVIMLSVLLLAMDENVIGHEVIHAFSFWGLLPFFLTDSAY